MKETACPIPFWDYCLEWRVMITNQLQGQTPFFTVHGYEGDISSISSVGFYDFVYFRDDTQSFPHGNEILGRYLGKSRDVGNATC